VDASHITFFTGEGQQDFKTWMRKAIATLGMESEQFADVWAYLVPRITGVPRHLLIKGRFLDSPEEAIIFMLDQYPLTQRMKNELLQT
jgi:hypothetical protein